MRRIARLACALPLLVCAFSHAADPAAEKAQSLQKLRADIANSLRTPCGIKPTKRVEVKLLLQENGYVQGYALVQSSGAPEFDAALMSAIADVQPFSLPKDAGARKDLMNLNLMFDAFSTPIPPCKR